MDLIVLAGANARTFVSDRISSISSLDKKKKRGKYL
jgi:hypothetical protein